MDGGTKSTGGRSSFGSEEVSESDSGVVGWKTGIPEVLYRPFGLPIFMTCGGVCGDRVWVVDLGGKFSLSSLSVSDRLDGI